MPRFYTVKLTEAQINVVHLALDNIQDNWQEGTSDDRVLWRCLKTVREKLIRAIEKGEKND